MNGVICRGLHAAKHWISDEQLKYFCVSAFSLQESAGTGEYLVVSCPNDQNHDFRCWWLLLLWSTNGLTELDLIISFLPLFFISSGFTWFISVPLVPLFEGFVEISWLVFTELTAARWEEMRNEQGMLWFMSGALTPSAPTVPVCVSDVDECKDQSDEDLICDHFCHNYIGGYYCSCRYGYLLHSDNRTCRGECELRLLKC